MKLRKKDYLMHPNLLYQYAIELQHEREKELLNLTEEEYLIRKAKLVKNPIYIKLPHINLLEIIQAFNRNLFLKNKKANGSSHSEQSYCAACKPL